MRAKFGPRGLKWEERTGSSPNLLFYRLNKEAKTLKCPGDFSCVTYPEYGEIPSEGFSDMNAGYHTLTEITEWLRQMTDFPARGEGDVSTKVLWASRRTGLLEVAKLSSPAQPAPLPIADHVRSLPENWRCQETWRYLLPAPPQLSPLPFLNFSHSGFG